MNVEDDAYVPPTLELEEEFERKEAEKQRAKEAAERKLANQMQVALTVLLALVFLGVNTLIFAGIERRSGGQQWAYFDALWFLVITTTTIGFGDMSLDWNREPEAAFEACLITVGLVLVALATGIIVDLFEQEVDEVEHTLEDKLLMQPEVRRGYGDLMLELGGVGKEERRFDHREEYRTKRRHRHRLRDEGKAGGGKVSKWAWLRPGQSPQGPGSITQPQAPEAGGLPSGRGLPPHSPRHHHSSKKAGHVHHRFV